MTIVDMEHVRGLFNFQNRYFDYSGGGYKGDPYPVWNALRDKAAIHEGTLHELTGFAGPATWDGLPYADRTHFSIFSFAACDSAFRDNKTFLRGIEPVDIENGPISVLNSMLSMAGKQHRVYRGLVQPSFVPAKARWWIENWIEATVRSLIDNFESEGKADLSGDFCAVIPVLTIAGSFGIPVEQALVVRDVMYNDWDGLLELVMPIVRDRRAQPKDDLISVLVEAEITDEDGVTHELTDREICSFAALLFGAGSGTTWKQMMITLAALLQRPEVLETVIADKDLLPAAIEESLRWMPTDPMFSRLVAEDIDFYGTHIPKGAIAHLCLGAANRDPERWDRPDEFDILRPPRPALGFGGGSHICLGMHVARAEMRVGIGALLDRLPNLRLDSNEEPPRFIGFYERGVSGIPVLFG